MRILQRLLAVPHYCQSKVLGSSLARDVRETLHCCWSVVTPWFVLQILSPAKTGI